MLEVAMIKERDLRALLGLVGLLPFPFELLVLSFELLDPLGLFFELAFSPLRFVLLALVSTRQPIFVQPKQTDIGSQWHHILWKGLRSHSIPNSRLHGKLCF
jgi:hypothetical protein